MIIQKTVNPAAATLDEILSEIAVSQKEVAESTGIPSPHLSGLKNGTRRFTPEYDLRLSRYFRQSEGFWLRLQTRADIRKAKAAQPSITREVRAIDRRKLVSA